MNGFSDYSAKTHFILNIFLLEEKIHLESKLDYLFAEIFEETDLRTRFDWTSMRRVQKRTNRESRRTKKLT